MSGVTGGVTGWCPRCLGPVPVGLPVEPLFSFDSAALLVPCTRSGLRQLVSVHKAKLQPPIYRRSPTDPRLRLRYLYGSDIVTLRSILFSGERFKRNSSKTKKVMP